MFPCMLEKVIMAFGSSEFGNEIPSNKVAIWHATPILRSQVQWAFAPFDLSSLANRSKSRNASCSSFAGSL